MRWLFVCAATLLLLNPVTAQERPNILWISCEDMSPDLGCYGDAYAVTPNIDRLAAQGVRYTHVLHPRWRLRPVAVRADHGHVSVQHRHPPHALPGRAAAGSEVLPRVPPRRRLLLHQQRQDRLQVQPALHRLGREQRQGPLAKPGQGPAVLLRHQPDDDARKPGSPEPRQLREAARQLPAGANSTTRPRRRCRPTIPTRRSSAATGPTITTSSPPWTSRSAAS